MEKYSLFLFLAFVSEILGTVSGFGSSILFVPLASLFFDFKTVLGITAVFHVFSNLSKITLFRQGIDKQIVLKLGIPAVLFVLLGAWMTTFFPTASIALGMNIVLVGLAVYLLLSFNKRLAQTNSNLVMGGVASGFLAGIAGTGGAIRGLTLAAFQLPKEAFVATSAMIDLGVDSSRAIVYVANGYFEKQFLILVPFLLAIGFLGTYVGKLILQKTSERIFRYVVLAVVLITALLQLFQTLG